jgi:hypothetical protein
VPDINAPSLEYRRHHPVEAPIIDDAHFRQAWRRADRLDKLVRAGLITRREHHAAAAFRALYELAHRGPGSLRAQDWNAVRAGKHCRRPATTMTERQAAALTRLRVIAKSLGRLYPLLEWTVVEEESWCAIGRRLHIDRHTARVWSLAAIASLCTL